MTNQQFKKLAISDPVAALKVWLEKANIPECDFGEIIDEIAVGDDRRYMAETAEFGYCLVNVHHIGGSEGEGEHVEVVLGFASSVNLKEPPISFLRTFASYNSYEGTDWGSSEWEQVYPREVLVTQYFNETEASDLDRK